MTNLSTYINIDANQGDFVEVAANTISGNGGQIANITGANVTGAVGTASVASTAYSVDGANVSGTVGNATVALSVAGANVSGNVGAATVAGVVTTNAQPNITSLGTLSSLSVTGNVSAGGITTTGNISGADVVSAVSFAGNGSALTGMYSNTNVAAYLPTYSGNLGGTLTTAAQPGITSVGATFSAGATTVNSLSVSTAANITGNLTVGGNVNFTSGNINQISGNSGQFFGDANGFGALYAGISAGYANIGNTVLQLTASANNYTQLNFQNINGGSGASADYILTADNGTDTTYYADLGIASSTYAFPGFGAIAPNDVYLLAVGDDASPPGTVEANLVLLSPNGHVHVAAGGADAANIITTVTDAGLVVLANTVAANTTSGALQVTGGAGVAGNLHAGNLFGTGITGTLLTASQTNITALGVITALSATGISANTLQTSGNAQIGGNLNVSGNINAVGNINIISGNAGQFYGNASTGFGALYAGIPSGYTLLQQEVMQYATNFNGYAQISMQNINAGDSSTSDYVATSDDGTDSTNFIDMGIAGSGYNGATAINALGTSLDPNDGYLYTQGNAGVGGNLIIGSNEANGALKIIAGGGNTANIAVTVTAPGSATTMNVAGGVTATSFTGNGAALTSVTGANITGTVANATYSTSANAATFAGTVTTAAQPNITSVGTLTTLDVTGNVSAAFYTGNGSALTGIVSTYGNANVALYLANATTNGNIFANKVTAKQLAVPYANTNAYDANIIVLNGTSLYRSNSSIAANIPFAIGNTANTWSLTKQWVETDKMFYVDPTNGLDTNDGSVVNPVQTVARGQALLSNVFGVLYLYPGTYTETVTWTKPNTTIIGPGAGDMVNCTGAWNFTANGTSVRVQGVSFGAGVTHSGTSGLYLFQCSYSGNLNLNSSAIFVAENCNLADGPLLLNPGNAATQYTNINNCTFNDMVINGNTNITINNSQANNCNVVIDLGTAIIYNSTMVSEAIGNTVLTASNVSNVIINGSTFADSDGTAGAITIAGGYSFGGVNYDAANSVITGTSFGDYQYFDKISVVSFLKAAAIIETRVVPRANGVASGSTVTIDANAVDQYAIAALATGVTIAAPTGTLTDGQKLTIRIRDNTIAQTITWNAIFRPIGTTLPTTTVAGKLVYVGCIYNVLDAKWDVVSVAQEA
jgi:hypothetical protein